MRGSKLYVGNLTYSATQDQLMELFSKHGSVKEIKLIEDKGFAFVEMSTPEEADKAKEALNGQNFLGRTMKIDEARPRTNNREGGGGGYNNRERNYNRY
ncbi:MAG TPA: RNA-binding protein [Spirochaetia bacterium]|nr:RNA-binding protein [Spirochaetia bacterium]